MSPAAAPSRKRSKSARQAILTAAFALLEEEGFERLSIEASRHGQASARRPSTVGGAPRACWLSKHFSRR